METITIQKKKYERSQTEMVLDATPPLFARAIANVILAQFPKVEHHNKT